MEIDTKTGAGPRSFGRLLGKLGPETVAGLLPQLDDRGRLLLKRLPFKGALRKLLFGLIRADRRLAAGAALARAVSSRRRTRPGHDYRHDQAPMARSDTCSAHRPPACSSSLGHPPRFCSRLRRGAGLEWAEGGA